MPRLLRALAGTALAAGLTVGLASCTSTVAKGDVAATIQAQLAKQHLTADAVDCPQDLTVEVGQSVHCGFTVDGQPVDAIATVTSVDDGKARLAITTDARPIAQDLLARKVGEQVGQQDGMPVESSTCAGDLAATLHARQSCTITSRGRAIQVVVTVTEVDGGLIKYSVEQG